MSEAPSDQTRLGTESGFFPVLRWQSRIKSVRFEDDKLRYEPEESITVQFAPGLKFEARDFAIYGGLNPAPDPTAIRRPSGWQRDWTVAQGEVPGGTVIQLEPDLLATAMSLTDAAGTEQAQPFPRFLVFNLFGQGVAYFQSVRALVATSQPAEALFQLRSLAAIARRFEQMRGSDDGGGCVAVRLALDAVTRTTSDVQRDVGAVQAELLQAAAARGIQVPKTSPTLRTRPCGAVCMTRCTSRTSQRIRSGL